MGEAVENLDTPPEADLDPAWPLESHPDRWWRATVGQGAGAKRRTVLLVDADPSLRTVAKLHLGADVELLEVPDERAAMEVLAAREVDVAVCAFAGTRVDAAECLRQLRAHPDPRVARTPVLLLADRAQSALAPIVEQLGPAAAIEPPVTGPKLAAAVRTLVGT